MAAADARPIPLKNTACRVYFPLKDASGNPVVSATGLDSEFWNINADPSPAWEDCANEAVAIGQGMYYLDVLPEEMNFDGVLMVVKSNEALQQDIVLYPAEDGDIRVHVTAFADGLLDAAKFAADFFQTMWDKATSDLTTAGSIGKALVAAFAKINLIGTSAASLPPPPSAETITLYLGTVYADADGTAYQISSNSAVDYTGATAKIEFGGHTLPVTVSGTVGAWVFRIQMSTDDQASLVPSEASYTLVPRLSVRQYDSPPVSTGMLRLMTSL